jgi:hypothetical protein
MKLVALYCPQCAQPLAVNHDDVLLTCGNCRAAVYIDDNGPRPAKVYFAAGRVQESNWRPFWVFSGWVKMTQRVSQGGGRSGNEEAEEMWGTPRRLYVPAWELNLQAAQEIGARLIQKQPEFEFITPPAEATLTAATVGPADAKKMLEFIVLAIEARRKDWLRELTFHLEVGEPDLWALPQSAVG